MKNSEKIYIGKGTQVQDYEMFNVVINLSKAKGQTFIGKNGDTLLGFTFSKTKQPDKFGKTHTAFVSVLQNDDLVEEKTIKPRKSRSKNNEPTFTNH